MLFCGMPAQFAPGRYKRCFSHSSLRAGIYLGFMLLAIMLLAIMLLAILGLSTVRPANKVQNKERHGNDMRAEGYECVSLML